MKRILLFLTLASCALAGTWIASPGKGGHAAAGTPLTTSLISYFKCDEASGNLLDVHGSKTFTDTGGVGTTTGIINTARQNASGTYFTRADDTSFEPGSSSFFITMWAKATTLSQASFPSIISKSATGQVEWDIAFNDSNDMIYVASPAAYVDTGTAMVVGTWQFIGVGWDGTTMKISVNGGAFTTTAYAGPIATGTSPVQILTRNSSAQAFQGILDEIAFWKGRCLTLAEVQTIYNSGAGKAYSTW